MNNDLKALLIFALGAAAGSAVTWYLAKKQYERDMQDLIDEYYGDANAEEDESEYQDEEEETEEIPVKVAAERNYEEPMDIREVASRFEQTETNNYEREDYRNMDEPYVITPEEFSDLVYEEYETETLTLYADGVLCDYVDNVIENVDDLVGEDSLNHFGEYEEDTVFVRNDHLKTGFEIQRDTRTFVEVVGN